MSMPKFVKAARVGEIPPGRGKMVMGPFDKPMALFNLDGDYYAVNSVCPHMGGPVSEGLLKGPIVACPWHGWTFDVRDGGCDHQGGHRISAYETKIEGDFIMVGWLKKGSEG